MQVTKVIAEFSTCKKRKVGAIILSEDRIIATGYNGTFSKSCNTCEDSDGNTFPETIHAEANAILFAAKNGIAVNGCIMLSTCMPCLDCAKMIVQSGIREIYYLEEYAVKTGLKCLIRNGIAVSQISDTD